MSVAMTDEQFAMLMQTIGCCDVLRFRMGNFSAIRRNVLMLMAMRRALMSTDVMPLVSRPCMCMHACTFKGVCVCLRAFRCTLSQGVRKGPLFPRQDICMVLLA